MTEALLPSRQRDVLDACLAVPQGVDIDERLAVYVNGYPARIEESLRETFPAVAHVVGPGAFCALVHRYVAAVSLSSYNLNDAGAAVPAFVCGDPLSEGLPFLADLATLEWRVARAFHAHAQPAVLPQRLAAVSPDDWPAVVLRFQPAVAVVRSRWPIREIWGLRDTPVDQIDIDLSGRPDQVLVYRVGFAVQCESIASAEALVLADLLDGVTLGDVMARLDGLGEPPEHVTGWFGRWMNIGLVTDCARAPLAG